MKRASAKVAAIVLFGAALNLIGLAAPGCAGAGGPRAYFAAERTRGLRPEDDAPVRTRNFIPVGAGEAPVRIACEARMFYDEPVEGLRVPTLHVRIYIANWGGARLELRPESFAVVDDAGISLPLARAYEDGRPTGIVISDARRDTCVDLVFPLPEGYDIEHTRSFRLLWGFRLDDREVRHETFFERTSGAEFRGPPYRVARRAT